MFKSKVLIIVAVLVLVLAVVAMSCAPAPKPAPPTPPAPPASTPPASTPPASTPPAATPPAAAAAKTSFEADTYTNDTYGISFMYPKNWIKLDPTGDQVFCVAKSKDQGADAAYFAVIADSADVGKAIKASMDSNPGLSAVGAKVDVKSANPVKLADGKTAATEVSVSSTIMGIYDYQSYNLVVSKGGKLLYVGSFTINGNTDRKNVAAEIVKTFAVK